jgi:arsenical pump membrane protein
MRIAMVGAGLLLLSLFAVACGILPIADAAAVLERVAPVLGFVVAMTIVAELAAKAGLFDVVAHALGRLSRGRTWVLWLLVVLLAIVTTAFLSLDTTAVLLTPVVVVLARSSGLPPLPFALTTVWLANTASLVLPVSNLTNLLAMHPLGFSGPAPFIALLGWSALIAMLVPPVVVFAMHRRMLVGGHRRSSTPVVGDRPLLRAAAIVVALLLPALVSGLEPWIPASAAAVALIGVYAIRAPRVLRVGLVPWALLLFAVGLFLVIGALEALGSGRIIAGLVGTGDSLGDLLRMAGAGLVGANVANNLPAYLALESSAHSPSAIAALLVGVNAGPLITPWASLATLLWHDRLVGLLVAPLTVALAVLPLA